CAKQPGDRFGLAQRSRGLEGDMADDAVGAEERGFEKPRALAALFQNTAQRTAERQERSGDEILGHHRIGETMLHQQVGQDTSRADRLLAEAQRAVELENEGLAEAGIEFAAAASRHLRDSLEAGALERM